MDKSFDEVLRVAFEAGYESHIYDPSDRPVEERFRKWRHEFGSIPEKFDDDFWEGVATHQ